MEIIQQKFKLSNYKIPQILVRFRKFSPDKSRNTARKEYQELIRQQDKSE